MSVPNPKDPLYWCAAAYKSMGNETFYNASRGEETAGKDVKFEIEMVVPDAEENGVRGLKKAETFVVAFRESEFMHLTGKQHFSDDKTTNDSKKFLRDCLVGNIDMTTFAGQTYEIEKNGYGFLDRIEALKNFKKLMCSIPERSNEKFGIYTVDKTTTAVKADYVIEFKGNAPPIGTSPAAPTTSYTSFFLVRDKDNSHKLNGMSCFVNTDRYSKEQCEILNITKYEKNKSSQALLSASISERQSAISKISDYNNGKRADFVFRQIKQYREKMIKNPDEKVGKSSTNEQNYQKFLHDFLCNSKNYPDEFLLKLKEKYENMLKTANATLEKHLQYELNAIDSILLVRHLEELRNDMIENGNSVDYENFFNLADNVSETSLRTQKFLSDNQIHGDFADYMPHMKKILSGILKINEQNKGGWIKKSNFKLLTKEQEKYLRQDIELLDDEEKAEKSTDISSSGAGKKGTAEFSVNADGTAVLNPANPLLSFGKVLHDMFNDFVDKVKEKINQLKQIFRKPDKEEQSETEKSVQNEVLSEQKNETETQAIPEQEDLIQNLNVIVTNIVTIKKSQELYLGNIPMKHNDTGYTHTENINAIQGLALADESGKIVYNPESEQAQQAEEQEEHHSQSSYDIDI